MGANTDLEFPGWDFRIRGWRAKLKPSTLKIWLSVQACMLQDSVKHVYVVKMPIGLHPEDRTMDEELISHDSRVGISDGWGELIVNCVDMVEHCKASEGWTDNLLNALEAKMSILTEDSQHTAGKHLHVPRDDGC